MEVTIKAHNGKGFAVAEIDEEKAGVMTFTIPNDELIIIDHTEVDPAFKGKDVGKKLLYRIVEKAREENYKIIPLCPFAHAMFKKLADIQDVLKKRLT